MVELDCPLSAALTISDKQTAAFARAGVTSLRDLLLRLPLRYENHSQITAIDALPVGEMVQIFATVVRCELLMRRKMMLKVTVADASGETCCLNFFHVYPALHSQFRPQRRGLFFGKVTPSFLGVRQMAHPQIKWLADDEDLHLPTTLEPVYPTVRGVAQAQWRQYINAALAHLTDSPDPLSAHGLMTFAAALQALHFPPLNNPAALVNARLRLQTEELLTHQLALFTARARLRQFPAPKLPANPKLIQKFLAHLPFQLTPAQESVCADIRHDVRQGKPMLRLVQGDVGSGKTIVALIACLHAVAAKKQAVFLAPTELLAEQHYNNFSRLLSDLPVNICLLTGRMRPAEQCAARAEIATGTAQIIVGTHAVFQAQVTYRHLALVAIDEQHRFGVHQRLQLQDKGAPQTGVHQLVLTATPIPRTLAMSHFGELDTSIIAELPHGRQPIITSVVSAEKRAAVIERVRAVCATGRQVYWVCPLIQESETLECENAAAIAAQLQNALPEYYVALLHGQMRREERQQVMSDFVAARAQILVATTVIEVGVDVPNASIMIIENAERFGLVQLHQLRGRIGRGNAQSYCLLLYQTPLSEKARTRLKIMTTHRDGFRIAEEDLLLRGAGEILGTKQTGLSDFVFAELPRDEGLLAQILPWVEELQTTQPKFCAQLLQRWQGQDEKYLQV